MNDLFYNISPANRKKLLKLLEVNTFFFKRDTTILRSIKDENIIGIIVSGYAQIIRTDYNGNRTIIEELDEGMIFGTSISSISSSECDIITKEDSQIIIIDYDVMMNVSVTNCQFYNQFIKNLLQIVTSIISAKNNRIEILTKKTIRNKLLEYFNINSKKNASKQIYLPFTFTDLADYLAVDRSAMSRELKYLKDEGFIDIKGKRITLLYGNLGNLYL